MKGYKRKLLALSIVFTVGIFMVLFLIITSKPDEGNSALPYGLPKEYRCIDVSRMELTEDESNISRSVIDIIKEDEDVVAVFHNAQTDQIYIFDPSGYYFNKCIRGKYFSREDFLKSDGSSVLLYENSAYVLMEDGGSVYCCGSERSVLGTFTEEHPLYKYYEYTDSSSVISDFSFDNEKYGRLYLANCSDQMVTDVKKAFAYAGWDVSEDRRTDTGDYYGLVIPGENHLIPAGMLALFAFCILLYITYKESRKETSFRRGICARLIPITAGCLAGCVIGLAITSAHIHKMYWNVLFIALGSCLGTMLAFTALSWTIFGRISKRRFLRKGNNLPQVPLSKQVIALIMAAVFFTSSYMRGAVYMFEYVLKTLPYYRTIERYDIVSFCRSYNDEAREDYGYTDKICTAAIEAINNGQAFSVFYDGSEADGTGMGLAVALGPLMKINGLKEPEDRYSFYSGGFVGFNTGDAVKIVNQQDQNASAFTAIVQAPLPNSLTLRISPERYGYTSFIGLITMSVEDYKNFHSSMHYVPTGLCFINPTGEQLKEYMNLLVDEGFHVSVQRWNGKVEGDSMTDFSFMLARLIAALAIFIELLLWTVEVVRMFLKTKKEEYRVIELYGGNPGVIGKRVFLLTNIIVMPGVLLPSILLPVQFWRYLGLEYIDAGFFYMFDLKALLVAFAVGIVFSLLVVLGVRGQFSINSIKHQLQR